MAITQGDGSKRATCPDCGQVVLIPAADPGGVRRGGAGSASTADAAPELTRLTPTPAPLAAETPPQVTAALHEVPTRYEEAPAEALDLAFLAPPRRADEIGNLGPYRVLGVIGAGGMGVVVRAHDPALDRMVALKAMLPALAASPTARQRFLREARAAAAIQHDRVVSVYQVGEDRGVPYLAMPLLRGESLDRRLARERPLEVREALRIAGQAAEGLVAIHDLGLIHRDVKPGNLFLEGEQARVKILDFGLARAAGGDPRLTQEGSIVGSPAFMAPEQVGRGPIDARTDLFGLGCVLYLMLTGEMPFAGDDTLATLLAVTTRDPAPPRQVRPALPEAVSAFVLRLLAKERADRPPSAAAVVAELAALATAAADAAAARGP